jgi:hypothetical protein
MKCAVTASFATAALSLGIAACGGGGDGDKLSKADLGKKANAICTDFRQEMARVPRAQARTAEQIVSTIDRTRTVLRGTVAKLEKITPADSVKADWENYVNTEKDAVGLLDTFLEQVTSRDRRAQQTLVKINAIVGRERSAALRIGAAACASKPAAGEVPAG